jgi:Uma2 family endonuclease
LETDGEPAKNEATYDDLFSIPEHHIGQIVRGVLYSHTRPNLHARPASTLLRDIGSPFDRAGDGPGGWLTLFAPELHFQRDVLVPDLAGWRRDRMPEMPDVPYFTLAPDWICEVLSPSTAKLDRVKKLPVYAHEGVKHAWLVDPSAKTLEVFELRGDVYALVQAASEAETGRYVPFDAIELELAAMWSR